jgi:hypothetical protein
MGPKNVQSRVEVYSQDDYVIVNHKDLVYENHKVTLEETVVGITLRSTRDRVDKDLIHLS